MDFGLRRRRRESAEGEDDAVMMGGGDGARSIELDLSLNPPNPGGQNPRNRPFGDPDMNLGGREFGGFGDAGFNFGNDFDDDESGEFVDESERSEASFETFSKRTSNNELDEAVMLAIEAKRTHVLLRKLYWLSVLFLGTSGILLVRINFKQSWKNDMIGETEMPKLIEGIFGMLVVITIAFRSDFPFNISVLIASALFSGFIFGIVFNRHSTEQDEED